MSTLALVVSSALLIACVATPRALAQTDEEEKPAAVTSGRRLPFLGDLARDRGIELPLPLGVGGVYYFVSRDITVSDLRLGRDGASPTSIGDFAQVAASSRVNNLNVKFDMWVLPFVNVYAIAGYVWNETDTTFDLTLPPLSPGGAGRSRRVVLPTSLEGTVGGLGVTLAGGYGPFFLALDSNAAQADLGFDDRFHAVVTSLRSGWNGKLGPRPFRVWGNATYWTTFATASGTLVDPDDGGTLSFEVDQGPAHPWTFGAGLQYSPRRWLEVNADAGTDFKGGWYVAFVPVVRF
jgi:hypothetical protein